MTPLRTLMDDDADNNGTSPGDLQITYPISTGREPGAGAKT